MNLSNYPPGVTGREYQIAGPDYEKEYPGACPECNAQGSLMELGYDGARWIACGECGYQRDLEDTASACRKCGEPIYPQPEGDLCTRCVSNMAGGPV